MDHRDERELLCQAQGGSSAAFGVLAQRYRPLLVRVLSSRRVPAGHADDLVQETLTRAFVAIRSYDPARPFGAWLTTIAVRVAATHRRHRAEQPIEHADRPDPSPQPADALLCRQQREDLWMLAERLLPARQYDALYLRYGRELSVQEIAAAMRISGIHVKVLLYRARRALSTSQVFREAFGSPGGPADQGGRS